MGTRKFILRHIGKFGKGLLQVVDHLGNQSFVGRRKLVCGQLYCVDPSAVLTLQMLNFTGFPVAMKGIQPDEGMRVLMIDRRKLLDDPGRDSDFFAQLPVKAVFNTFPWLDFASGEFPHAAEFIILPALTNEDFFAPGNDRNSRFNTLHSWSTVTLNRTNKPKTDGIVNIYK